MKPRLSENRIPIMKQMGQKLAVRPDEEGKIWLEDSTSHEQALQKDTPVFTMEQLAEAFELVQKPPIR